MNEATSTPDRLLSVGRKLFADNGFDGTSIRQITSAARANLGAVTYHFGSKRKLYDAVLHRLFSSFADSIVAACETKGSAPERLQRVVSAIFEFFAAHPDAPQLILQELARAGGAPASVVPHARRNLQAIGKVVTEGQRVGELRDVQPALAAFTILSQSIWFTLVRKQLVHVTTLPIDGAEGTKFMERHIADVVTRSFATEGGTG